VLVKQATDLSLQLNALFCCLWRNVEAYYHKHFVVVSRYQHRRLLPAEVSQLAGWWSGGIVSTTSGLLQR